MVTVVIQSALNPSLKAEFKVLESEAKSKVKYLKAKLPTYIVTVK